eukprot:9050905-Pyramimonas_sp.AAC.1
MAFSAGPIRFDSSYPPIRWGQLLAQRLLRILAWPARFESCSAPTRPGSQRAPIRAESPNLLRYT